MPITPKDIETVAFSRPPLGKRGYSEDEVDTFLDMVQVDLEKYLEELEQLRNAGAQPLMLLESPQQQHPPVEPISAQASRVLELAQKTAEQLTSESQEQANRVLQEAQQRAAQTLTAAQQQASDTVRRAEAEEAEIKQRIEALRLFETTYHERLVSYMEGQLDSIKQHNNVEPPQ